MEALRKILMSTALATCVFGLVEEAVFAEPASIHVGDKLQVDVYNHPELSSTSPVDASGNFPLQVGGPISVAGLSTRAAELAMRTRLQKFLLRPAVGVRIVQQGQTIFFSGFSVGVLNYSPGMTLASAIGSISHAPVVQGQSQSASQAPSAISAIDFRDVGLKRSGHILGQFNIESLGRQGSSGPQIEPGDDILLRSKPVRVDVLGDVRNPGPQYVYPNETLAQAADQAGGFSATTSTSNISLTREGSTLLISSASQEMNAPARDGDVLSLAPAPHVTVLGMVTTPGEVVLKGDTTLLSSLYAVGGPNRYANLRSITVVRRNAQTVTYNVSGLTHGDLRANVALQDGDVVYVPEGHKIDPLPFLQALGAIGTIHNL